MKKIISIIITLAMCLGMGATVFAADSPVVPSFDGREEAQKYLTEFIEQLGIQEDFPKLSAEQKQDDMQLRLKCETEDEFLQVILDRTADDEYLRLSVSLDPYSKAWSSKDIEYIKAEIPENLLNPVTTPSNFPLLLLFIYEYKDIIKVDSVSLLHSTLNVQIKKADLSKLLEDERVPNVKSVLGQRPAYNLPVGPEGDADGNGSVNIKDVQLILRYIAGHKDLLHIDFNLANVNRDYLITIRDAILITKIIANS